jgi:hypothetical protein
MPRVITEEHQFVAAVTVDVTPQQAQFGARRGVIRLTAGLKVDVLDLYCAMCRRPWDDVADQPCSAYASTEHLRGGPLGERKKRKHHQHHDCEAAGCDRAPLTAAAE